MQIVQQVAVALRTYMFIHGYGVLTTLSLLAALFLLWRELRRTSCKEDQVFDMLFIAGVMGLITGRLLFFLLEHPPFRFTFFNFLIVYVFPGFSALGIFVGFFGGLYLLSLRYKQQFTQLMQLLAIPFLWMTLMQSLLLAARDLSWVELAKALLYTVGIVLMWYVRKLVRASKIREKAIFPFMTLLLSFIAFLSWIGYSVMREGSLQSPTIEALAFGGIALISAVWFTTVVTKVTS